MLIHATRQPLADSRIRLRSCNGGCHITCSDSKMKVERKAKQNIHDCNDIKTMNAPVCLPSKRYPSEAFALFIKN